MSFFGSCICFSQFSISDFTGHLACPWNVLYMCSSITLPAGPWSHIPPHLMKEERGGTEAVSSVPRLQPRQRCSSPRAHTIAHHAHLLAPPFFFLTALRANLPTKQFTHLKWIVLQFLLYYRCCFSCTVSLETR